ncbi:MAG TPA: YggS family pyridoxal phosphate-dependent enzyme [Ignavibacteria bacterium]|nr:YggS family pyridoxal phosphate-dependent enzyme [Ignavibacteria bacterium]
MSFESIKDNYVRLKRNIKEACERSGRGQDSVKLIAVSKTFPAADIKSLYELGHRDFGENKVQELGEKNTALDTLDIYWHLIGHLQTNKVKFIIDYVSLIHSVDSIKLADEIQKRASQSSKLIDILVQVNTSGEDSKFGVEPSQAGRICSDIRKLENIRLRGLMTIGKLTENEDEIRENFRLLKNLYDELLPVNNQFEFLSMGMTSDYEIAIEEGSNMIRVGSAIFGERDYN